MTKESKLRFFTPSDKEQQMIPFLSAKIQAGFASPANDFIEMNISLDKELIGNKDATYYARVEGSSMEGANIHDGDLLVIDRSIEPQDNKVAVCFIDGGFTVKRLRMEKDFILLMPENDKFEPIKVTHETDFFVWGVVTYIIKSV